MYGISSSSKDSIAIAVERMFDQLSYNLLGNIPKLREKSPFFSSSPVFSLAHIFIEAIGRKEPNVFEKEILKGILNSSYRFIESLKHKTSSNVVESVDALVKESKLKNQFISSAQLAEIISVEMDKARSQMKLIAEAETTKTRNIGHTMEIVSHAEKQGIDDPTCFFIIVRDNKACLEENELIITTKGATPVGKVAVGDILKNPSTPSQKGGNKVIFIEKKQKETIELDFGNEKLVCTKDHPILVRFGKILCFMEADKITEDHDVVLANEFTSKGDLKMITRAKTPREFMKKLGYFDAWDFWRENIDDIIMMAKACKSRIPIMKKYGMSVAIWDQYVIHVIKGYDKTLHFVGSSPKNNFSGEYVKRKSLELKMKIENKYASLGGDSWFTNEIKNGRNCQKLATENNLPVFFLRNKIRLLGLLSLVKARGVKSNWNKNREKLIKLSKNRGTPHFQTVSRPEKSLGIELKKVFKDLEINFCISNMKVDFFIPSVSLVMEYDGSGHNLRDKLVKNKTNKITNRTDFARDLILKNLGFRIFRIKSPNDKYDSASIIESIKNFIISKKVFDIWQN